MSVFLDNNYISAKYDTQYPMNCLVHTYNKKYFNNQNEAANMLMEKVLLPGEVAFGYYYDPNTSYGINAIFAVGPLSHNGGNILFHNLQDITKYKEDILGFISNISNNIDYIQEINEQFINNKDELINIINTANNQFQTEITNLSDLITNSVNDLNTYISQEKQELNNIIQSSLDSLQINLKLSPEYVISSSSNSDLKLKPNDTFETAFGKLEKIILDNETVMSNALNDLYKQIQDISANVHQHI